MRARTKLPAYVSGLLLTCTSIGLAAGDVTDPGKCRGPGCASLASVKPDIVGGGTCKGPGCESAASVAAASRIEGNLGTASVGAAQGSPSVSRLASVPSVAGLVSGGEPDWIDILRSIRSRSGAIFLFLPAPETEGQPFRPGAASRPVVPAPEPPSPPPSTMSRSGLQHGAGPADFDNGLDDCDIPFEELQSKATSCTAEPTPSGQVCQTFSRSQFTEVVQLSQLVRVGSSAGQPVISWEEKCSGTLLSPQWVLMAAHCVVSDKDAAEKINGSDYRLGAAELASYRISADNVMTLESQEAERGLRRAVIYGRYAGQNPIEDVKTHERVYYNDDLALVQLTSPLPAATIEPARVARAENVDLKASTLAGFGYSNARGGTLGFFVTWSPEWKPTAGGHFSFAPGSGPRGQSAFCQGDSGGPLFSHYNRGCRPTNRPREIRPRYIEGVISYNRRPDVPWNATPAEEAQACVAAQEMAVVDITLPERRNWICETTDFEAGGC